MMHALHQTFLDYELMKRDVFISRSVDHKKEDDRELPKHKYANIASGERAILLNPSNIDTYNGNLL